MDARPATADAVDRLERVERIARLMDTAVTVPGTNFRVGLDFILGIVPGIGDTLAVAPSLYILYQGYKMGVPRRVLRRMAVNAGLDYAVGLIPILGDLFDAGFKANRRNARLIREHMERHLAEAGRRTGPARG